MRIPGNPVERQQFYDDLVRQCSVSRTERFNLYQSLRNYYLYGSASRDGTMYNKIGATVDTLASFIYSPDAVRFAIHLGETAVDEDVYKSVPLAREVLDQWRISGTHLRFALALRWSLVYGCMLMKVQWSSAGARTYLVEPHQFGVLREDVVDLADQEAYTLHYTTTRTQLHATLEGNPRRASIMERVGRSTRDGNTGRMYAEGLQRLMVGGPVGGVSGSLAIGIGGSSAPEGGMGRTGVSYDYAPRVEADLIDMCDLYVMDDEIGDYQLISIASPDVVIYDRPQRVVGVPGMPHFAVIRPEMNLYDYFWGESFVARVCNLQDWRSERVEQIRGLMAKQYDPPMFGSGMGGISEEKFVGLRAAGGRVSAPTPGAKLEILSPEMPKDAFAELAQIDQMFDDVAGIGHVLQGKGEPGVRSRGQADLMARLGSSRPKARAVVAEEAAEDIATLILRNVQEHSPQRFTAAIPGGKPLTFIAEQFTVDYEVKVDGHSSSPIFVEDRKHDALTLLEAHAIDRETLIDMFDPPNAQTLKARLKEIEAKEAKQAEMQMAMEQQQSAHKGK